MLNFISNETTQDIILLNEIKCNEYQANDLLNISGYNCEYKIRNENGGGVAILIKSQIKYEVIENNWETEAIGIIIELNNSKLAIFSYYNRPSKKFDKNVLDSDFLKNLELEHKHLIICGDLNARIRKLGCTGKENDNFLLESNLLIVNNEKIPTFHIDHKDKSKKNYKEVLDYVLCSPSVEKKISELIILDHELLGSDHSPISITISFNQKIKHLRSKTDKKVMMYNKANWEMFRKIIENEIAHVEFNDQPLESSAENITNIIKNALKETVPTKIISDEIRQPFPTSLVKQIKLKNKLNKINKMNKKFNFSTDESQLLFNNAVKQVKASIAKFNNDSWNTFVKN